MNWAFLWSWLDRKSQAPAPLDVLMYTRHGCHLCDAAWELLQTERARHPFTLRQVDVDSAAELAEKYGAQVPVVVVNGRVRFRGVVSRVLWRRLLHAEAQRAMTPAFLPPEQPGPA